jgi:hypothetical protein
VRWRGTKITKKFAKSQNANQVPDAGCNKVRLLDGNTDLKMEIFFNLIFVLARTTFKKQLNRLIEPKNIF